MKQSIWMRVTIATVIWVSAVQAQNPGQDTPGRAIMIPNVDVQAKVREMIATGGQDEALRVVSVANESNLGIYLIYLNPRDSDGPITLSTHDDVPEVYFVLQGEGIVYHGGTIDNPTPRSFAVVGPGTSGIGRNYLSQRVGPGDLFIVTPDTPHQVNVGAETEMVYLVVRIDPEKHLELQ